MMNHRERKVNLGRMRLLALLLALLLAFGLSGCQTSAVQEEISEGDVQTEVSEEMEVAEDEYIDAAYVDAHYGEGEEEDLSVYSDTKKGGAGESVNGGTGTEGDSGNGAGVNGEDGQDEEGQDEYHTDPVPEGQQSPVEPEDAVIDYNTEYTCTLYVECSTILNNWEDLKEGKEDLVPSDGVIYGRRTVTFNKGESVYDILQREMRNNRIHMEASFTPMYNSAYVEGINNLYEFDCGDNSGWMYCVNGWYPNYGCSRYQVENGDSIEWHYTCDLGRDLGQ